MSSELLKSLQAELKARKYKGKTVYSFEEEPLSLDIMVNGTKLVSKVQIEALGVYSYRACLPYSSPLASRREDNSVQSVGIIVNIAMEGMKKIVSFES